MTTEDEVTRALGMVGVSAEGWTDDERDRMRRALEAVALVPACHIWYGPDYTSQQAAAMQSIREAITYQRPAAPSRAATVQAGREAGARLVNDAVHAANRLGRPNVAAALILDALTTEASNRIHSADGYRALALGVRHRLTEIAEAEAARGGL